MEHPSSGAVLVSLANPCAEQKESQFQDFADSGQEPQDPMLDAIFDPLIMDSVHDSSLQCTAAPVPLLSFADIVLRGINPSDMPSICTLSMPISGEDRLEALGNPPKAPDLYIACVSTHCPPLAPADKNLQAPACLMAPLDAYGHSVVLNPRLQLVPDGTVDSLPDNQAHLPTQLGFADALAFSNHPDTKQIHNPVDDDDLELTPSSIKRLSIKYSLDTSNYVGAEIARPNGGQDPVYSKGNFLSTSEMHAMDLEPWKTSKSRKKKKAALKKSRGSSGS